MGPSERTESEKQPDIPANALYTPSRDPWWQQVLLGATALILGLGTLWFLKLFAWPLALLIGGLALAAGFAPVIDRLSRWLPRGLAVVLFYLLLLLLTVALGWLVLPPMITQGQEALERMPDMITRLEETLANWLPMRESVSLGNMLNGVSGSTQALLSSVSSGLTEWMIAGFVVFFSSIYALILAPKAEEFILSLFPPRRRERVQHVLARMADAMGGWVRGTLINSVIVGLLTVVGLLLLGYDLILVLGVISGVMEVIPSLGPIITGVLIVLVGLLQSTDKALMGLAFAVVMQQIESNIVAPNVMKSQAHISPIFVLLALIAGERIGGLVGALVAIPLTAALRVFVIEVIAPLIRDWTGAPPVVNEED